MPIFRVEIYKNYQSRDKPGSWSNVYEVEATGPGAVATEAVLPIVNAERAIHLSQVEFLRWTAGQFITGTNRLDPNIAPKGPLTGVGLRATTSSGPLDLETCYQVKFQTGSRAFAKKAYRGVLREDDVNAYFAGKWQLQTDSDIHPGGSLWLAYYNYLKDLLADQGQPTQLTAYTQFQTSPRKAIPRTYGPWLSFPITAVNFLKVGNVNRDHKWFNRR